MEKEESGMDPLEYNELKYHSWRANLQQKRVANLLNLMLQCLERLARDDPDLALFLKQKEFVTILLVMTVCLGWQAIQDNKSVVC